MDFGILFLNIVYAIFLIPKWHVLIPINMINDHHSEGDRVKNVSELVLGEPIIGRKLQLGNELVLKSPASLFKIVKAHWVSNFNEELSQLIDADERCGFWIKVGPDLPESCKHILIEESLFLHHGLSEPLQNDCDKKVQEYQVHKEEETEEEKVPSYSSPASYCLEAIVHIVLVGWGIYTFESDTEIC